MGAGRSKVSPLYYEEAVKRVSPKALERIEETFKRSSLATGYLPQATFIRDVLGETVPGKLSEAIYQAFGGTQKGLLYKELLCGLVLIVHGSREEKAKFIAQMISEDGCYISREMLESFITTCDVYPSPLNLSLLFKGEQLCTTEKFQQWILSNPTMSSFSRWLLEESPGLELEGESNTLTFYQILSHKYRVSEKDVMDVERMYWALKGGGKLDLETFERHISPPMPQGLISDLFRVLDVNSDGHLDLSEILNAVSISCGGHWQAIHRFWFSVFDTDYDGFLSREELVSAISQMLNQSVTSSVPNGQVSGGNGTSGVSQDTACSSGVGTEEPVGAGEGERTDAESIADSALAEYWKSNNGFLNSDEYLSWAMDHAELSKQLPDLFFEICHVQLGVRPKSLEAEARVIGGYLSRFAKSTRKTGEVVFLINTKWFQSWMEYTGYQGSYPSLIPSSSSHKKHKKKSRKIKQVVEHSAFLAPPTSTHVIEQGEEVVEIIEANEVDKSPDASPRSSGLSDVSETSIQSQDDILRPPPIDNSVLCVPQQSGTKKLPCLTNEGGKLLYNIGEKDFVLLPEVVWKVFVSWYCSNVYNIIPALPRTIGKDGYVDLFPVFFTLYRHTTVPPPLKPSSLPWPLLSLMHSLGFSNAQSTPTQPILSAAGGGGEEMSPTQAPTPRRVAYYTAAFVETTTLSEVYKTIEQLLHVKSEDLRLYDLVNENSPVLLEDETLTIRELGYESSRKPSKESYKLLIETRNKDNTWPEEMIALVKEMQEKDKNKHKSKPQDVHVQPGATGLSNLGNTCFMNSALQCVSNAKPLTQYFQNKDHLLEINRDNPLGMQGVMAKRYGELIHELWSGNVKSITPLKFRFTVGRCAPHFNGFQQQDAQELLAFVLDGLHEDLNRVKDKAYKELNDSDGRPDEEVAQEAWDYHLSRNRSIIVDLFHGQLKSQVTCKVCKYKSVRFDPFTFLSLPLPMESTINLEVIVMFLDGRQSVRYGLRLEIDDKYRQLKEKLTELCGIPSSRILLVEVYCSNIRNWPSDTTKIRSVLGGWLYAYELPDTILVPTTQRSDSPDEVLRRKNLEKLRRERTLSLKQKESQMKAARVREKLVREGLRGGEVRQREELRDEEVGQREELRGEREEGEENSAKRQRIVVDVIEGLESIGNKDDGDREKYEQAHVSEGCAVIGDCDGEGGDERVKAVVEDTRGFVDSDEISNSSVDEHRLKEGFLYIYAVHRRVYTVDNYFVSNQKTRYSLFSLPILVPCTSHTIGSDLYASVWTKVKRLIIPDPPNSSNRDGGQTEEYPFLIKQVTNDGMNCSKCPWYRFCHGCVIPCNSSYIGRIGRFIAIDWDETTLHLKYLMEQERPEEHESMESLKIIDTQPIDLYKCFKAFVREDQLGDEESWYCKKCKTHREAVKSLEIWRFPPILIIHLKRFQFVNGRWIKSQRTVTFPLQGLDPLRYTVQNGNGSDCSDDATPIRDGLLTRNTIEKVRGIKPLEDNTCEGPVCPDVRNSRDGGCGGVEGEEIETIRFGNGLNEDSEVQEEEEEREEKGEVDPLQVMEDVGDTESTHAPSENGESGLPKLYDLFAISCHSGVLGGGHYTSFAKNSNGTWYYFNDSSCKETTPERVELESPYMLFYQVQNIDEISGRFRAEDRQGMRQDIGTTEDDREYEETLKNLKKNCVVQ